MDRHLYDIHLRTEREDLQRICIPGPGSACHAKDGRPFANLVAFAATEDLRILLFSTSRSTRKFSHILDSPQVALLIDNRTNSIRDFGDAVAITALGRAIMVKGRKEAAVFGISAKHPHLTDFISTPNQALLKVEVSKYILVGHFQRVLGLNIDE